MCYHLEDDTHSPSIVPPYLVAQKYGTSKIHWAKWYLPTSSIPTLSISHFVNSHFVNSHLVNVDQVGTDKVGIDEVEIDEVVKHTVPSDISHAQSQVTP